VSVLLFSFCEIFEVYFIFDIPVADIFTISLTLYLHQNLRFLFPILKYKSQNNLGVFTMRRRRKLLV